MTTVEFQYRLVNIHDNLMKFAYSLTFNRDEAEDLVQETLLKALKNSDKFVYESSLKAWTFTILKNTFINNFRRKRKNTVYSAKSLVDCKQNDITASRTYNPESIVSFNEIEKVIETLTDHFKTPLKMHYEGYKYKEIAEILEVNIGTVKSRIFLSRQKLIAKLKDFN